MITFSRYLPFPACFPSALLAQRLAHEDQGATAAPAVVGAHQRPQQDDVQPDLLCHGGGGGLFIRSSKTQNNMEKSQNYLLKTCIFQDHQSFFFRANMFEQFRTCVLNIIGGEDYMKLIVSSWANLFRH